MGVKVVKKIEIVYIIKGEYVVDVSIKNVKVGDLVAIGDKIYMVVPALGGNRVQLVNLEDGKLWSYAEDYDHEKGIPLKELVGRWVKECYVLKEADESV